LEFYNYFLFPTPPTTQGTYKVFSYISTATVPFLLAQDTFDINIVCDTCKLSRDNNTYVSSRWAGTTGTTCDPYTAANKTYVAADRPLYGISCTVNNATKPNSKIKAVLYKWSAGAATIVAQSNNYYILTSDVPTTAPMVNPPTIRLPLATPYTLQKDTMYYLGIQVYGGTDTVKLAMDNTGLPQNDQSSQLYDPTANQWYVWDLGVNVPAVMISGVFNQNEHWSGINDVKEVNNSVTLFSCMPNPANASKQLAYELKNNEKVNIIISDITGRVIENINQGSQTKGNYTLNVDLSKYTSGTYFYTLKTQTSQVTDKLIVVKR